jgi:predicted transposase/invertase (TIGR01784 family)
MEKLSATPHDAVFKQMLAHKEVAQDFLQIHLPAKYLALCDMSTLQLVSGSFIEEDLRASYSDILYSVQTQHGPGYLYALIEHQSTPDKLMAFRLMRYAIAAMQRHIDAGYDALPLVIPMLFYHGTVSPWPHSMSWQQLFNDPQLAHALYSADFPLVDLTVIPDNHIVTHRRMAMLELLQKHIRQRDLAEWQEQFASLLMEGHLTEKQIGTLVSYMLQAGTTARPEALLRRLAQRAPQHKDLLMTIAQWLEEKGRQKGQKEGIRQGMEEGIKEGIKEGMQKGREEETRNIARKMLACGIDTATVMTVTGLTPEALATLTH